MQPAVQIQHVLHTCCTLSLLAPRLSSLLPPCSHLRQVIIMVLL
jgi:hypothetical protein